VFLDEIGEVSAKVQVELLRVLEDKSVTRLGGNAPLPVDFRVVAATHRDLAALVKGGSFRDDLYWRLNVFTIAIPPLRERPEDVPPLAEHFLARFAASMGRKPPSLSAGALEALTLYSWPGNVRELQNAIERAMVVCTRPVVEAGDLPLRVTATERQAEAPGSLAEMERAHVTRVLEGQRWNISRAARVLGIDRVTLYNKIKRYGLRKPVDGR
jgi:DNA-binding NtrC family response regulator